MMSDNAPTAEDLLQYRALGEACYIEHGLAPALYAALYTRHTGTSISSDCGDADAPDVQQLRLTPATTQAHALTLRPTLATSEVFIDGLNTPTQVYVLAADGRRVATATVDTGGRLSVNAPPAGVYALQVEGEPAAGVLRFVKR